jgi:glyoxylase-like metal-dependent hydrolase (beta-lactamase superfamily II)
MISMKEENLQIKRIEAGPFGTNAYVLICTQTGESVLIDAPGDAERMALLLRTTALKYILITHNHMDHTGALERLKSVFDVPVAGHEYDANRLPIPADILLSDGNKVAFGRIRLDVLHTPGHTPGSLCFLYANHLFSGDTLFPHGPGRTNTPSDFQMILDSLKAKIFVLPDEVHVYPGHGEETILKSEKDEFQVFSSRSHVAGLCGDVLWLKS